jgi:hypothetical protein
VKGVASLLFSSGIGPGDDLPQWAGRVQKGHQYCFTVREAHGQVPALLVVHLGRQSDSVGRWGHPQRQTARQA